MRTLALTSPASRAASRSPAPDSCPASAARGKPEVRRQRRCSDDVQSQRQPRGRRDQRVRRLGLKGYAFGAEAAGQEFPGLCGGQQVQGRG